VVQVHLGPRDSPAGQGLSGRYEGASARCDGGCCRRCGALTGTPRSARSVARGDRAGTGGAPRCTTGTPLGDVAQLAEHCLCKAGVRGSIPLVSTTGSLASFVRPAFRRNCLKGCSARRRKHHLDKVDAARGTRLTERPRRRPPSAVRARSAGQPGVGPRPLRRHRPRPEPPPQTAIADGAWARSGGRAPGAAQQLSGLQRPCARPLPRRAASRRAWRLARGR